MSSSSFETTEALRNLPQLKEGGSLHRRRRGHSAPAGSSPGAASHARERPRAPARGGGAAHPDADAIARAAGNAKCAQCGARWARLAARLDIPVEVWEETVAERVPQKTVEANLAALRAGATPSSDEARREDSMTVSQISVFAGTAARGIMRPGARPLRGRRRVRARLLRRRHGGVRHPPLHRR